VSLANYSNKPNLNLVYRRRKVGFDAGAEKEYFVKVVKRVIKPAKIYSNG
jgi:hypothetical protein